MKDDMKLEMQALENCRLENIKKVLDTQNLQEVIKQNERLKAELDREIKKNRKLVEALKEYASKKIGVIIWVMEQANTFIASLIKVLN